MVIVYLTLTRTDLITKAAIAKEEAEIEQPNVIWQVVVVVGLLLILSLAGYYWRSRELKSNSEPAQSANSTL